MSVMSPCIYEMVNAVLTRRGSGQARRGPAGGEARPRTRAARRGRQLGRVAGKESAGGQARGRAQARAPALGPASRRDVSLRLRRPDLRPVSRRFAPRADAQHRLPLRLAVHIDETGEVRDARIIWRRGPTIGVRLDEPAPADALKASDRYALRRRYYAVPG
jgi:hypothetical protein